MNELKKARFFKGISQARIAKEIGIDAALISKVENDLLRDMPAVRRWKAKIAEFLETPVDELFPETMKPGGGK
jgi:transcriptional regulator with XRE-family HTH domain